jgi:hypothetical protein
MPDQNVSSRPATPAQTLVLHPVDRRGAGATATTAREGVARSHEHRIERLIDRLPKASRRAIRWLRRPSSRWVRIPAGVLLVGGAFLSVLPFFGIWMLPLGLMLLAEDLPPLRRVRDRVLDWIAQHRPHWLAEPSS